MVKAKITFQLPKKLIDKLREWAPGRRLVMEDVVAAGICWFIQTTAERREEAIDDLDEFLEEDEGVSAAEAVDEAERGLGKRTTRRKRAATDGR